MKKGFRIPLNSYSKMGSYYPKEEGEGGRRRKGEGRGRRGKDREGEEGGGERHLEKGAKVVASAETKRVRNRNGNQEYSRFIVAA